ncbi:MAG: glycosyltransferase family 4 protein [Desulfobacterales bacterium]
MEGFPGKVGLIQRVLPEYRVPFFNALGRACKGGLSVFAGAPKPNEMIKPVARLEDADLTYGRNLHILSGKAYLCIQSGLLDWLQAWNPDILIVEANPRYLRTPASIRWMQGRRRPVIGWGLGSSPAKGLFGRLRTTHRERFIRQFDSLITYSQTGASGYADLGFPPDRIFVAANAVTPPPDYPLPARPDPSKIEKAAILFVGRLQARKRVDNLLRACAQLPESLQPGLTIVGDGPAMEGLRALAAEIYPEAVFTGAHYGDTLADDFRAADLFVLPGTGGLAIQQAMSYGLPVIAAEADGTQADLVRPRNGWQVPPGDLPALTSTLETALSDLARLRVMGAESYRIVSEEINLDRMVTVFIEALTRTSQ